MYIAWAGWFKIIPSSRLKEDDAPLIAMVLNFLYLLILFILSFVTEGTIQDNIMVFMIFNWFYNAIFIIIGILLYVIVPDKK
jgi:lipopolysaccharide export LptBFGC system permease protein LptF